MRGLRDRDEELDVVERDRELVERVVASRPSTQSASSLAGVERVAVGGEQVEQVVGRGEDQLDA